MSAENFKLGDVVQLKSGGPSMTVTYVGSENTLYCKWFEGSKVHEGEFPSSALKRVPEDIGQTPFFGEVVK